MFELCIGINKVSLTQSGRGPEVEQRVGVSHGINSGVVWWWNVCGGISDVVVQPWYPGSGWWVFCGTKSSCPLKFCWWVVRVVASLVSLGLVLWCYWCLWLWCYRWSMVTLMMSCEVWGGKRQELLFGDAMTASREIPAAWENISAAYEGVKRFSVLWSDGNVIYWWV